jgi:phosphatidate cytidylyltransferase
MAAPAEPSTHWSKKPLTLRVISAAVLIPIVVVAVYAGHPAWDFLVVLFGGVMAWEWTRICARNRFAGENVTELLPEAIIAALVVVTSLLAASFRDQLPGQPKLWFGLIGDFFLMMLVATLRFRAVSLWFGLGILYVLVPCVAIISLRADPVVGLQQILWIVALVIFADTGAYMAGRSIGGPKLAPRISPNKTWAGLGGAVVSAAIMGAITGFLMDRPSWALVAVSGVLGIVAQAGDLAESAFKRHFGVKDASNIIPGHGGALDRVDGLIAVAAAVAGLNAWIGSSVLIWL